MLTAVRSRLGEREWGERLGRLLQWVCERGVDVELDEAERVLVDMDGHVGEALARLAPMNAEDSGSEDSKSEDSNVCHGCDDDVVNGCNGCNNGANGCHGCDNGVVIHGETLDAEWWNDRFREDGATGHSDWLLSFEGYGDLLTRHVPCSARTLVPGCGNSPFSAKLHAAGYRRIVNTDISNYVVEVMRERHADPLKGPLDVDCKEGYCEGMTWEVDDVTSMQFGTATFDAILDKSLLDCMTYVDEEEYEGCMSRWPLISNV